MTQLTETTIAIVVPGDATNHRIGSPQLTKRWTNTQMLVWDEENCRSPYEQLPPGEWSIVGTASWNGELECDFDAALIVELLSVTRMRWFGYKNYIKSKDNHEDFTCPTANESLASLLQSKGLYWGNPFGDKPAINHYHFGDEHLYFQDFNEWQAAQSKCLKENEQIVIIQNLK